MWFLLIALVVCVIGYGYIHFRHRTPKSMNSSIDSFSQKREVLSPTRRRRRS